MSKSFAKLVVVMLFSSATFAAENPFFTQKAKTHTLASTVPLNGDTNPYAVVVSPVTSGRLRAGDVLVDNFNDESNRQGLGTTIVRYSPETKSTDVFTNLPRTLAGCPGGVGLTTAMTILKSGFVLVGSAPSQDGTTATKGEGCLILLNTSGELLGTFADANISDPWGNMAVSENGEDVSVFVSNAGFNVPAPTDSSVTIAQATILRLQFKVKEGQMPALVGETVVGSGFGEQADKSVFLIGPTGLALDPSGTLYVADSLQNRIVAIDQALTRGTSAGQGREIFKGAPMNRPLALIQVPNGNLVTTNGLDGQAVEIDPRAGKAVATTWLEKDKAVTPWGSGDLFGLALKPDGRGLYFVKDDKNLLSEIDFE